MSDELALAVSDLEEADAIRLVQQRLDSGEEPLAVLASCQEGMTLVGKRYEAGEYFISDLMMAGELFKTITAPLSDLSAAGNGPGRGRIVFGTVKGDIHNIGKDIVVGLLRASGYEVLDLGVDVPPQKFVDAVKETEAKILGLSGLLTVAFDAMKETVAALETAGLRSRVRVMIGGGPMTVTVKQYTGADEWSINAQDAVSFADRWTEEAGNA